MTCHTQFDPKNVAVSRDDSLQFELAADLLARQRGAKEQVWTNVTTKPLGTNSESAIGHMIKVLFVAFLTVSIIGCGEKKDAAKHTGNAAESPKAAAQQTGGDTESAKAAGRVSTVEDARKVLVGTWKVNVEESKKLLRELLPGETVEILSAVANFKENGGFEIEGMSPAKKFDMTVGEDANQFVISHLYYDDRDEKANWEVKFANQDRIAMEFPDFEMELVFDRQTSDNTRSDDDSSGVLGSAWASLSTSDLEAYLKAGTIGKGDHFGSSVAVSGDTAVVGALDEDGEQTNAGAAYVFTRGRDGMWNQQAYLKAANAGKDDQFGWSVAVSGDTIVVGAREAGDAKSTADSPNDNAWGAGAAYVFTRGETGTCGQLAYLKASDAGFRGNFGMSVAVSGDTIVVGARSEDPDAASHAGAAYVFIRNEAGTWSQQAKLEAPNAGKLDHFGSSVAVAGDTIVVGAPYEDGDEPHAHAAYVFTRTGTTWSQQAYLEPPKTDEEEKYRRAFGSSVAVSGDTVVVGAPRRVRVNFDPRREDEEELNAGAAFVFTHGNDGNWSQQAYLKATNAEYSNSFGYSVAVSGDTVVVGWREENGDAASTADAPNNNAGSAGAACVFIRTGPTWSQLAYLKAGNAGENDHFGGSVAASGDTVVVGAERESGPDYLASAAGAAYVFKVSLNESFIDVEINLSDEVAATAFAIGAHTVESAIVGGKEIKGSELYVRPDGFKSFLRGPNNGLPLEFTFADVPQGTKKVDLLKGTVKVMVGGTAEEVVLKNLATRSEEEVIADPELKASGLEMKFKRHGSYQSFGRDIEPGVYLDLGVEMKVGAIGFTGIEVTDSTGKSISRGPGRDGFRNNWPPDILSSDFKNGRFSNGMTVEHIVNVKKSDLSGAILKVQFLKGGTEIDLPFEVKDVKVKSDG